LTKVTIDKIQGEAFLHNHAIEDITGLTSPFLFQGSIDTSDDFPLLADVQNGWTYIIIADVTDNDGSKTNTGQSFVAGDEIVWNGVSWTLFGNNNLALNDLNDVTITSPQDNDILQYQSGEWVNSQDLDFGLLEFVAQTEPGTPPVDSSFMFQTTTGTSPTKQTTLYTKNEEGEKIIISTLIN
jgi:hypothetical protein